MKICVMGTGYVGLVTAAGFADAGHDVLGVDSDAGKIAQLSSGKLPIFEPELEELLKRGRESNRLTFSTELVEPEDGLDAVFVCVGTPTGVDGLPDTSAVFAAARAAAPALRKGALLVVKSTVPVGTCDRLASELGVDVAFNPEFLKEGTAVEDFLRPDRVVIGVRSARARELLRELYEPFVRTGAPIIETDPRSAEMAKYASNGMLACRISFMNEVARLCDALEADVEVVRRIVGSDKRIGGSFLFPGPGFGGSCFPKDVRALMSMGEKARVELPLIEAIDRTNSIQRHYLAKLLRGELGELRGKAVAIWGLAFKPRTDDCRESPALDLVRELLGAGCEISAFDPAAMATAARALGGDAARVRFAKDRYDAARGADALVLVTEWPEFRRPDPRMLAQTMRGRLIVDGRNVLDIRALVREGFTVRSVGRPVARPQVSDPLERKGQ